MKTATFLHSHRWVAIPGRERFPHRLCRCGVLWAPSGVKAGRNTVTLDDKIDMTEIAAPAAPGAGITRLFMDSADGALKGIRGAGAAETILPASGGGFSSRGRVFQGVAQSIPNNVLTQLTFNTVQFDGLGEWDAANNQFVVTAAGQYLVIAHAALDNVALSSRMLLRVDKTGQVISTTDQRTNLVAAFDPTIHTGTIEDLAAGNFIKVFLLQDSGAAVNTAPGKMLNYFTFHRLS